MGRSTTFKYRVEQGSDKFGWATLMGWKTSDPGKGAATATNLERYRMALNSSFLPGGVNEVTKGQTPYYANLRIVEQKTGKVVAVAHGPMFEIVEPPVHPALSV